MSEGRRSKDPAFQRHKLKKHLWRRMALAVPISLLLHLLIVTLMRPEYQPVSDFAVEMDVIEMGPVPPPREPQPAPPSKAEDKPAPKPEPTHAPAPKPAPIQAPSPKPTAQAVDDTQKTTTDSGVRDSGVFDAGARDSGLSQSLKSALAGSDAGVRGGGICMHDLFAYAEPNPSWMLWISLSSFRNTVFQRPIGSALSTYGLTRRLKEATGIDPGEDAEGLIVTARNIFNWRSFRVIVSYDSGEGNLRRQLDKHHGKTPSFTWLQTDQGWEATLPGDFRWHLVSSGRVLVSTYAPPLAKQKDKSTQAPGPKKPVAPSGVAKADRDGGSVSSTPFVLPPGSFPDWPRQVSCLSPGSDTMGLKKTTKGNQIKQAEELLQTARSFLKPDAKGHWPVALLATSDPRAVGLSRNQVGPIRFRFATIRVYFGDPVRIEGTLLFSGDEIHVAMVATAWRKLAQQSARDPFLALAGLSHLFDTLELNAVGPKMTFSLEVTERQVEAALIFFELQGEALERQLKR